MGRKITYDMVKTYVENRGYTLLSTEYKNAKSGLLLKCPQGHITSTLTWDNFHNKQAMCRICYEESKKLSFDYIKDCFEKEGFLVLSDVYKNAETPLEVICPNNHEIKMCWHNFKDGNRCYECSGKKKKTYEYVKTYIESKNYKLLSQEYINSREKLIVQCFYNHKPYPIEWNSFQQGRRCPMCSSTKGEVEIMEYLNNNNIDYYHEYIFNDCKNINHLEFDFYIKDLNLVIEFDGEQHFRPIDFFDAEEGFINTIIRDAIKNQYCEDKNINILRIPYWEFNNIKTIIKEKISNLE